MSRIYLRHPKHGEKIAYLEAEAVMDEKAGWVRFNPEAKSVEVGPADKPNRDGMIDAVVLRTVEAPPEAAPRRRGRPPKSNFVKVEQ